MRGMKWGTGLAAMASALWLSACGGTVQAVPTVRFTAPSGDIFTRSDTVTLQVLVVDAQAERVELVRNGVVLVQLIPPFQYIWDTRFEADGEHTFVARITHEGRVIESDPRVVVLDRKAPTAALAQGTPPEGGACAFSSIDVAFSEAIRPDTLEEGSVRVRMGGGFLPIRSALLADQKTLRLQLKVRPSQHTRLAVELSPSITDLAGNLLRAADISYEWRPPEWCLLTGVAPLATKEDGALTELAVASDSLGRPSVALGEPRQKQLAIVRRWEGVSWGAELPIQGFGSAKLALVNSPDDALLLAVGALGQVRLYRHAGAGAWELFAATDAAQGTTVNSLALALFPDGSPLVGWTVPLTGGKEQLDVGRWNGVAWDWMGEWDVADGVEAAMDADGRAIVAFMVHPSVQYPAMRAPVVARQAGSGWEVLAGLPEHAADFLRLAVLPGGEPVLAYADFRWNDTQNRSDTEFHVMVYRDNQWVPLGAALNAAQRWGRSSSLIVDSLGRPVLAWVGAESGPARLQVRRWEGDTWVDLNAGMLMRNPALAADHVALAADPLGGFHIVWTEGEVPNPRFLHAAHHTW